MNVHLMFPDKTFDMNCELPEYTKDIRQDLDMDIIFDIMSGGKKDIGKIAEAAVLTPLCNTGDIIYRQDVLKDCLKHPEVIRELYAFASEVIEKERKNYLGVFKDYPDQILTRSINVLELFAKSLEQLREIAKSNVNGFSSKGFKNFFEMLIQELDNDYMSAMKKYLKMLKFQDGIHVSASLESGLHAKEYVLHSGTSQKTNLFSSLFGKRSFVYTIPDRGRNEEQALSMLKDRALVSVAAVASNACECICTFFSELQDELSFYLGCINLHKKLHELGLPICFPDVTDTNETIADSLSNLSLVLRQGNVVPNNLDARGKKLVIITGANQGGKTNFLKSIAQAQIIMQCGMFVPANAYKNSIFSGIYTHFTREEDSTMKSGKLDEELRRMSKLIDFMRPGSIVFFNDSFASTNEREGSEIAKQIVNALLDSGLIIYYVTHFYKFCSDYEQISDPTYLFLKARIENDKQIDYRIVPGQPQKSGFLNNIYKKTALV